nr:Chain A, isocitrate dehydrogenase [Aeropyrum pernix]1TYO_B Chain B, isocitrate dehydrogenase [Aeropyrum pernix]1V94_A Chain A, isocitrate dehydrogenase [Aeropyrum pernix]1V94_B Chain B, isocitrate dehydrogenase [Aeropyrum pernix]1XGV_A Chain A, Isocitrate dehydrogenase [Aeropyrum pernix]1XGV_B Chain B, Isocitrate dehydrogenase [Aeropyrum pernix]1XKD_A Chain A, isocitrate dehydrogenase [Aeropyrum pernix K1]1XKD_B Chain B, isocitrate dehydrogenase [Aeropyrum pernix K1]
MQVMASPPCTTEELSPPPGGSLVEYSGGSLRVPDNPVVAFIRGDGVGPEVVESALKVVDAAVKKVYGGSRRIVWWELLAGHLAREKCGELLPKATLEGIRLARVALKGPLETPVGTGYRSLNVAIRQALDLYANIRPVRYYGQPAPHKYADRVDMVIFRENTEDVYAGIEWPHDSPEAARIRRFLAEEFGISIREDAGIGVKPISRFATRRLMERALEWALRNGNTVVTIMHKGNIMKYTEGAFMRWAYEVALEKFREHVVTEQEVQEKYGGVRPEGKILVNDRIADNMLQQIITRPWDYQVIVAPNLNGDYISDAASALVGGIGMAAGMNMGDGIAVAEPVHGTAPKYAGKDLINPSAEILSASLLIGEFMGWREVKSIVEYAIRKAVQSKKVTQDLARHMPGVQPLRTSEYTETLIAYIDEADLNEVLAGKRG